MLVTLEMAQSWWGAEKMHMEVELGGCGAAETNAGGNTVCRRAELCRGWDSGPRQGRPRCRHLFLIFLK